MAGSNAENVGVVSIFGNRVDILREVGRGGFGTVYMGWNTENDIIAVKKVAINDMRKAIAEAVKFHFMKDNVCHDHVIKVYDVKRWRDSMWIMMEFCDFGDLNKFFSKFQPKLDTRTKLITMGQISKGITFLHNENIVHRDIKPGNILLKSSNGLVIVKLGDFGLSKFLDPSNMTSAMSSNLGTQWFKAPEFWDRKPNGRLKYHRNVDVYAAGLTFAAMLQATEGHTLEPKIEGSLQSFETNMPIGLAAFKRYQNNHNEIQVVVQNRKDTPPLNKLKSIIEGMTCFSPKARVAAAEVEKRIDVLTREVNDLPIPNHLCKLIDIFCKSKNDNHLTTFRCVLYIKMIINKWPSMFQFLETMPDLQVDLMSRLNTPDKDLLIDSMCYANNKLVVIGHPCGKPTYKTKVYDGTGSLLKEWNPCHTFPCMMEFEVHGKDYLLEGCRICRVIRGYEFPSVMPSVLSEQISPSCMCAGPDGTVLVFDSNLVQNGIKQLRYYKGQLHLERELSPELEDIRTLCYSKKHGIAIAFRHDRKAITGIDLVTGNVLWQHVEIPFGSSPQFLNDFRDIFTLPDGRVCIFSYTDIFTLDPVNGIILNKFLNLDSYIWTTATCENFNQPFLAIAYDTKIFVYKIRFQPCKTYHYLPLQDIVSEEEDMETNDY